MIPALFFTRWPILVYSGNPPRGKGNSSRGSHNCTTHTAASERGGREKKNTTCNTVPVEHGHSRQMRRSGITLGGFCMIPHTRRPSVIPITLLRRPRRWMDRSVPAHPDLPHGRGGSLVLYSFVVSGSARPPTGRPLGNYCKRSQTLFERHLFGCLVVPLWLRRQMEDGPNYVAHPIFRVWGSSWGHSRPDPCAASPKTTKIPLADDRLLCTVQTPQSRSFFFFFSGAYSVLASDAEWNSLARLSRNKG